MIKPGTWFDAVQYCQHTGKSYVLVTVLGTSGSTPRDSGTKMVVVDDCIYDTIGGGHLEHQVTRNARKMLAKGENCQQIEPMPLDASLGQCCGGAVHVLYEVITQHSQHIAVFGAGHVAKALIPVIAQLPLQIHWIDNRENMFTQQVPENVSCNLTDVPAYELNKLPPESWILVMTHNHQLDFEIVLKAMQLNSFDFVGMIGSETKARRFKKRLQHRELSTEQIGRLVSPVGDLNIPGKRPIEVAISIAAQLTRMLNNAEKTNNSKQTTKKQSLWSASKLIESQIK